jgi:single-strand DNA-binding protein
MNEVILYGRVANDPDFKYVGADQKARCGFNVAVNYKGTATFIPVVVWDKLAENCGNTLQKGNRVLVKGRIEISTYTKDERTYKNFYVVAVSVTFIERKDEQQLPQGN